MKDVKSSSLPCFTLIGLGAFLLATVIGCGGSSGSSPTPTPTPVAPTLSSITVTPATASVAAGLTQQFKATGTYSDNSTVDITSSVTWSSGTATVAGVGSTGLATSKAKGSAQIIASSGSINGSAALTVTAAQIVSLAISPTSATMQIGSATPQQFAATATYTDQSTQDLTDSSVFTVSNPWIASPGQNGVVSALSAGFTSVTAVNNSLSATANLTVLASPRYLYAVSDAGRDITRMVVNASTGQPRFLGYQSTGSYQNIGASCITMSPNGAFAYITSQTGSGSAYSGLVNIYSLNASTGKMTPVGSGPYSFSDPIGCLQFAPGGKFSYATPGVDGGANNLTTFSVNADGTLTFLGDTVLSNIPGGLAIDPMGNYLYVAAEDIMATGAGSIYGYSIDANTGALTPIPGTPMALPEGAVGSFAFHPNGNFLYFSNGSSTSISEYSVNRTTGAIAAITAGTLNPCINPGGVNFSPDGTLAYINCQEDLNHSVLNAPLLSYTVGANGQLSPAGSALSGPTAGGVVVDPSGKYLYLIAAGSDAIATGSGSYKVEKNVMVYKVAPSGAITLINQIAGRVQLDSILLVGGENPVTWTPEHAYLATAGDNHLTSYAMAQDGSLNPLQSNALSFAPSAGAMLPWGSDLLLENAASSLNFSSYAVSNGSVAAGSVQGSATQPGGIVMDPSGIYAFQADASTGLVYEYMRSSTPGYWETLLSAPATPLTWTAQAGTGPVTTDPAGRYLIVANQTAKSISLIAYAGEAAIAPISLTYTPLAIAMDPTGNLLLITGDDLKLHVLFNNGLGTLTDEGSATLAGTATSIAISPAGNLVYAAGVSGLNAFSLNSETYALTPITLNLPVSAANATGVFIDPSGVFLYLPVSSSSLNALYRFSINTDGTLAATNPVQVAAPNHATAVLFDAQIQ